MQKTFLIKAPGLVDEFKSFILKRGLTVEQLSDSNVLYDLFKYDFFTGRYPLRPVLSWVKFKEDVLPYVKELVNDIEREYE